MNFENENEDCGNTDGPDAIVAQGQSVDNDSCYTSALTVSHISESFNNKSVECAYDDGNKTTLVNSSTITVVSGNYQNLAL